MAATGAGSMGARMIEVMSVLGMVAIFAIAAWAMMSDDENIG